MAINKKILVVSYIRISITHSKKTGVLQGIDTITVQQKYSKDVIDKSQNLLWRLLLD